MNSKVRVAAIFMAVALIFAAQAQNRSPVDERDYVGNVAGTVLRASDNTPIEGAAVYLLENGATPPSWRLHDADSGTIPLRLMLPDQDTVQNSRRASTAAGGHFLINAVPTPFPYRAYSLLVVADGYEPVIIENMRVLPGAVMSVDATLALRPAGTTARVFKGDGSAAPFRYMHERPIETENGSAGGRAITQAVAPNSIYATREGLVGHTTANGHVIQQYDHFVALPSRRALSSNYGYEYQVKVSYGGKSVIAPVWDVGPWNTKDDYWNSAATRETFADLPQFTPEAQAAYLNGYNGGKDSSGRTVTNPAGIDLADGTFWTDLGLTTNSWVTVDFQWVNADTVGPSVTISSPCSSSCSTAATSVFIGGTATDSGGSGLASVFVDNATANSYGTDYSVSGNSASYGVTVNLVPGQNVIYVQARDAAGNYGTTASITITTTSCSLGPLNISAPSEVQPNSTGNSASASASGASSYSWSISNGVITSSSSSQSITFSAPSSGAVTLYATAYDANRTCSVNSQRTVQLTSVANCTFSGFTDSIALSSGTGGGTTFVSGTPSGCNGTWSVSSDATSWLTITGGASGSGSTQAPVTFSFIANSGPTRVGHLNFSWGAVITVTQSGPGPCNYTISPLTRTVTSAASSGTVTVSSDVQSCTGTWTAAAASSGSWLTLTGVASGNGGGTWTVPYSFLANSSPTASRSGTINFSGTFPSGNTFTLTQNAASATTPAHARSDFGGDGRSDVLWRNTSTGENYLWTMNGLTRDSAASINVTSDVNWKIAGTGDFDGDGKADILWRHATTGANYIYLMNGSTITAAGALNQVDVNWNVAGVADFDGDGKADILWRNAATGENYLYRMNGLSILQGGALTTISDLSWKIVGCGDLNGDGKADIVWRNTSTGAVYVWLMNGFTITGAGTVETIPDQNWTIAAVGDFDGDGKADLFWHNVATGENYLYLMNGVASSSRGAVNTVTDLNWKIAATGDYDGDGRTDILWRHAVTGETYAYLMNGFTIGSAGPLMQVYNVWQVIP